MTPSNSSSPRCPRPNDRRISVRGVRREQPDVRKLARAIIALALAQAEADAQAQAQVAAVTGEPTNDGASVEEGPDAA